MERKFNILTIDGGGIRGVFPAMFLALIEAELKSHGVEKWQIYQNFQLMSGTSTGGIVAIALGLGIPASEILDLYIKNAGDIFSGKKSILKQICHSKYKRNSLENLVRQKFKEVNNGEDPRLGDVKTPVCIPIYDLVEGKPSVLKSKYHPKFVRDYHIPAYQAALATSAAPTFFNPFSTKYIDLNGVEKHFSNKVDGGVVANNPALLSIIEAQKAFKIPLKDIKILSIGTGHQKFTDACDRKKWGIKYWLNFKRKRIMELFMQGQSQLVENLISLLHVGIDKEEKDSPNFHYQRIETELDETCKIELDETDVKKLEKLKEKAQTAFQNNASSVIQSFFTS